MANNPNEAFLYRAGTQPWVCSLSFWGSNWDTDKNGKEKNGNDTSDIEQKPWDFTLIFKSFTSLH